MKNKTKQIGHGKKPKKEETEKKNWKMKKLEIYIEKKQEDWKKLNTENRIK